VYIQLDQLFDSKMSVYHRSRDTSRRGQRDVSATLQHAEWAFCVYRRHAGGDITVDQVYHTRVRKSLSHLSSIARTAVKLSNS